MGPLRLAFLWLLALAIACLDFRLRRVPNRLILFGLAAGLIPAACRGWGALAASLAGFALGFVLLLPAFALGMVGGGDVKSLAVLGLYVGPGTLWVSFLVGAAAGGVVATVMLVTSRLAAAWRRRLSAADPPAHTARREPSLPYAGMLAICVAMVATLPLL